MVEAIRPTSFMKMAQGKAVHGGSCVRQLAGHGALRPALAEPFEEPAVLRHVCGVADLSMGTDG